MLTAQKISKVPLKNIKRHCIIYCIILIVFRAFAYNKDICKGGCARCCINFFWDLLSLHSFFFWSSRFHFAGFPATTPAWRRKRNFGVWPGWETGKAKLRSPKFRPIKKEPVVAATGSFICCKYFLVWQKKRNGFAIPLFYFFSVFSF